LSEAVEAGGDASEDEIDAALAAKSAELKALGYGE
jgi:antitoxin ParD1/3/4